MTHFIGGPVEGTVLRIRRAPLYLRVARALNGRFDALDQLEDTPEPGETLYAYRLVSNDGGVHINSRDAKTGKHTGGFFVMATYQFLEPQPDSSAMYSNTRWAEWTEAEYDKSKIALKGDQ